MEIDQILHTLRAVVVELEAKLPASDVESAWGLIDAGEPGVALENLCTQLYEYDVSVPQQVLSRIAASGEAMGLPAELWTDLRVEP